MWASTRLYRPMELDYAEMMANAAVRAVVVDGVSGLSATRIARSMNITPQALFNRYGGADRILRIVIGVLADRWAVWMDDRLREARWRSPDPPSAADLVAALLPTTEDDLDEVGAWLAIRHAAAHGAVPSDGEDVTRAEAREREALSRAIAGGTDLDTDGLHALVMGLRERMADRQEPMARERAVAIVRAVVERTALSGVRDPAR